MPEEVVEGIAKFLLGLIILISFFWYVIYRLIERWSKRRVFILINASILVVYTIYFINGRIYHSEYGGTLVWGFYMMLVPLVHAIIMGIAALIFRKAVDRS